MDLRRVVWCVVGLPLGPCLFFFSFVLGGIPVPFVGFLHFERELMLPFVRFI